MKTLYVFDRFGEVHAISRGIDGKLCVSGGDELPDFEESDAVMVFEGEVLDVRGWSGEQCDEADISREALQCDEWWKGDMRPATAAEILAVLLPQVLGMPVSSWLVWRPQRVGGGGGGEP
jgi:hypothetical protein